MERLSLATVQDRIKELLATRLDVHPTLLAEADGETPLIGAGIGLDSVEALALAAAVEEAFGIEIAADDFTTELFSSLARLSSYVVERV